MTGSDAGRKGTVIQLRTADGNVYSEIPVSPNGRALSENLHVKIEDIAGGFPFSALPEFGDPDFEPQIGDYYSEPDGSIHVVTRRSGSGKRGARRFDSRDETEYLKRLEWHRNDRRAKATVEAEEWSALRGPRVKRTIGEYAQLPQPGAVMEGVLAAEVNLLGGPTGAGKSLLGRDWSLAVAAGEPWRGYDVPERRNVLLVLSEGLHDIADRWESQPLWEQACGNVWIEDEPLSLVSEREVGDLLKRYADERPGLVVFDLVYAMGMADDNGVKDVAPVLSSLKRISAEWDAATLAVGHPGHESSGRRFRGSSMWRQLAAVEWHIADGVLTCEKSKIAYAARQRAAVRAEYPSLRWISTSERISSEKERWELIEQDLEKHPDESARGRARRLAPVLGLSEDRTRKLIREVADEGDG